MPQLRDMPPLEASRYGYNEMLARDVGGGLLDVPTEIVYPGDGIVPPPMYHYIREGFPPGDLRGSSLSIHEVLDPTKPEVRGCFRKCYDFYKRLCDNLEDLSNDLLDNHLIC